MCGNCKNCNNCCKNKKVKLPKSKKKRIQNKYIPKGIYCHGSSLTEVCPHWHYRRATEKDLRIIYDKEKKLLSEDGIESFEDFKKYLEKENNKEADFFLGVYECSLIHYTEYCQENLLWDQCKECGRNDSFYAGESTRCLPRPNKIRRKPKKEQLEWLREKYCWLFMKDESE